MEAAGQWSVVEVEYADWDVEVADVLVSRVGNKAPSLVVNVVKASAEVVVPAEVFVEMVVPAEVLEVPVEVVVSVEVVEVEVPAEVEVPVELVVFEESHQPVVVVV